MIYYLAHPYTNCDLEGTMFKLSIIRFQLEAKGLIVFSPLHHSHSYSQDLLKRFPMGMKHEYWIEQDLAILAEMMEGDGGDLDLYTTEAFPYDSRVTILLSQTAFKCSSTELYWRGSEFWNSQGCRQEYAFAKKEKIRVLILERFLEDEEVEIQ